MDKKCNKCDVEKSISCFHKDSSKIDGYRNSCKECQKLYSKDFYEKNSEKIKKYSIEYHNQHSNTNEFKLKRVSYMKNWYSINKQDKKDYNKSYYLENREPLLIYSRVYRDLNSDIINDYKIKNKDRRKESANVYVKNRLLTDEVFKLSLNIRNLIRISIKKSGFKKDSKSVEILGCSIHEFKIHIESKFEKWMSWGNHGKYNGELYHGWDIDHIIPISSAKSKEDVIKLNHYTNMRPLCSYVNRCIKKNKIIHGS